MEQNSRVRVEKNPGFSCEPCWSLFETLTGTQRDSLPSEGIFEVDEETFFACACEHAGGHGQHILTLAHGEYVRLLEKDFGPLSPQDREGIERLDREDWERLLDGDRNRRIDPEAKI